VLRAKAVDAAAVLLFVAIGRSSHHHPETLGGFTSTAWPFAVGLGAGWFASTMEGAAQRRPRPESGEVQARPTPVRSGLVVCATTVAVGMTLRVVAGQGTAPAFILVALIFLGAIMIGGRLVLNSRALPRPSPRRGGA
jgi:hypothetical protein